MSENRELGPEMQAEGWRCIGDEWIMWLHPPTRQSVTLDSYVRANCPWATAYPWEPADPNANGYLVTLCRHYEEGDPIPETGKQVWIESYGNALKLARGIRSNLLRDSLPQVSSQLTFDDLLLRGAT